MKSTEFCEWAKSGQLESLVERTLQGVPGREVMKTPFGEIYRDITSVSRVIQGVWAKMNSPDFISPSIPGLEYFKCAGSRAGARIVEQHFMLVSTNRYEGQLFHKDDVRKSWGMTNYPVKDDNLFDIPHNVVYHLNENQSTVFIGIDYCSSGLLGENALAKAITKASMRYAVQKVAMYLRGEGKK